MACPKSVSPRWFFPDTFARDDNGNRPFCTDCSLVKWGAWGSRVAFDNGKSQGSHYIDNIHLGWWVAGDLASEDDIDTLAALNATAHYDGHVLGDVAKLSNNQWKTYVAAGDLAMNCHFACRNGNLTISNFDGRSFATGEFGLRQPSLDINKFSGSLSQIHGPALTNLTGSAIGSFVRGPLRPAQGVVGNWNVKATSLPAAASPPTSFLGHLIDFDSPQGASSAILSVWKMTARSLTIMFRGDFS